MKSSMRSKNVFIAFAVALSSIALPTTASATGSVNVTASQTTVAPNESVQFTVDAGNGEYLGALFAESGTGWSLFDRGFVKDLPLIRWSTFSPACDTDVTVIYRVYRTLMVDYDPDNPPQYGDFATAGLVAGDSVPVEFFGSKCDDGIALVISNESTTLATTAGSLAVENVGSNKSVTWSISGGANAALFEISSTGLISFRNPSSVGTYQVTVTAVDAANETVSQTFTIVVSPAPVAPTTPLPAVTLTGPSAITLTPGQLNLGSYEAGSDVKWAIAGGNDAALFEISATGTLSFKSEPQPGTYTVIITATNSSGSSTSKTVTITVPVKNAPVISGGSLNPVVNPGERAVASYSADKSVRWSITGGSNASLFRISATGTLSFNTAATPGVYTVIITATDSAGNATSQTVTTTVPNRTPPEITGPPLAPSVNAGERSIAIYKADRDVVWSISGGANAALFEIDVNGSLAFKNSASPGTYTVIISATDSFGNVTNKTVIINVPTPAAVKPRQAAKIFSGFALGRSAVTPSMRRSIEAFVRANPNYVRVSITGFTQGPTVLWSDRALARARAGAVRAIIKRINPGARITIDAKTELAVGSNVRRARVVLTFS